MWKTLLVSLVNADKIGGWTRALVATVLGSAAAWSGGKLAPFLSPEFQAAVGVAVSTVAVGAWSQIAKYLAGRPVAPVVPPAA